MEGECMSKLPIEQVIVDKCVRQGYGELGYLAKSMRNYGLIHPMIVECIAQGVS